MTETNRLSWKTLPLRTSLGMINSNTLNKPVTALSFAEKKQLDYLKEKLRWSKKNGYYIVMAKNQHDRNGIDCWMMKDTAMPYLSPKFKQNILHVL